MGMTLCVFACLRAGDVDCDEHALGQQTHGSLKHTTITESWKHSLTSCYLCVCVQRTLLFLLCITMKGGYNNRNTHRGVCVRVCVCVCVSRMLR